MSFNQADRSEKNTTKEENTTKELNVSAEMVQNVELNSNEGERLSSNDGYVKTAKKPIEHKCVL
jgi:hypothetical protein